MQITNNSNGSGVRVNLIKGVSSEFIAEALIRINEQELNIIGYNSKTKTYRDEASVLRDNAQSSAYNANNSALLSTLKANEANLSANNAKEWASKEYGLEVETGLYSAKHYAIEASNNTSKVTSINGMIGDVVLSKSDVGLWSVDNTSDINKPISNDTQTALDLKANVANHVLIDSEKICEECGSTKVTNVALLGAVAKSSVLPISYDDIKSTLNEKLKPAFIEMNLKAFELGAASVREW